MRKYSRDNVIQSCHFTCVVTEAQEESNFLKLLTFAQPRAETTDFRRGSFCYTSQSLG